jgi:hypothetical protein
MNVPLPRASEENSFSSTMKIHCLMKRLCTFIAAWVLILPAPAQELFTHISAIKQGLSAITGLAFTRDVPYALITKDQLHKYLEQRMRDTMKPDDVRVEELTLKMLGLVPPDFDLRQNTLELLTEQAAAFYDYNQKRLFVLQGAGAGEDERVALVHELAHALADQHFHLAKFIHEGTKSDDDSTARQAVMEGQATWLMAAYLAREAGGPAELPPGLIEMMRKTAETSAGQQYPVFSQAPLYIRESLVFPYADGLAFQDAVFRKVGQQAFAEVFVRPPVSSGQIMHPERYLAHAGVAIPDTPAVPDAHNFRKLGDGTLGEFDFRILLTQYAGAEDGVSAAEDLVGGSFELLEHKRQRFAVLAVASSWDSPESAQRYFELYKRVMRGKWKTEEVTSETPNRVEGRGDSGYFQVWLDGVTVNQLEGLGAPRRGARISVK